MPGIGVMAKRPQGWVQCEDHLLYHSFIYLLDSTTPRRRTREDLGGGARGHGGPGPARVASGALGASMQREGAVPDSFVQNKMTRIASLD
jgi:hypothetical protein